MKRGRADYSEYCPGCGELHNCAFGDDIVWCPRMGWLEGVRE